jgi:integrase
VWKGWHAYRRGLATNLHALGVDDKTIQAILRHEDVSTTQRSYIKAPPRIVTDAMKQLEFNDCLCNRFR